ncbi:DEAD/DEAH box helicase [Lutimaribacter sp. EGI FJ00015]|uniref:DEAD/DEAH box helicase n=1 Tax=Lutimaribacter degradans TaxID=2945989 RepID=A0ACC5ZSV8_9RHOB|nr:DEAD/DEAH box helicase [Lutimaribacter sp. EGI FJ00013]MCM2561121.1 DEAD/DEAH box helicase [Lutimaribacter sp. EGI FJ00013]MCO0611930.1 DEAD/DEAH box helicase [Lutimaribacter sp. EGI FJ00015]MCO0634949.1 DEAD/DEAH box helicase [Lutimaribacter sp. EGI FJ00014]
MTETFQDLGLPAHLLRALEAQNITTPTPIQSQAIPHALNGRDVMGLAQTGTGKTNAFGLPLVTAMLEMQGKPAPHSVRGLILAPTRELARQIQEQLLLLIKGTPMKVGLVVGGASLNAQANRLARGTDILVATPGRLLDLLDRRALNLAETRFLVLDEADQMLDMGFIHALRKIAALLPEERQTMLFSATMPKQMEEIAQSYLVKPARIQVNPPGKPVEKIEQEVHFIAKGEKLGLLKEMLDGHRDELALVFGRTKHGMEKLAKMLEKAGFAVAAIHGNKSQGQRQRALEAFKTGRVRVLVATDVAARGLDIPEVRHVYNYELPNVPDNYVHRIGRTARAGRDGRAVAFCAPEEMGELKDIQKVMKRDIPVASGTPWEKIMPPQGQGAKPAGGRGKPGGARRAQQRKRSRGNGPARGNKGQAA